MRQRSSVSKGKVLGSLTLALTALGLGVWSALAPIASAVVASGQFVVSGQRAEVQHPDGGIVAAVYVRDGDMVRAGAPLIDLDPTELDIERRRLREAIAALDEQIALIGEEADAVRGLLARGYAPRTRHLELQRRLKKAHADRQDTTHRLEQTEAQRARATIRASITGTVMAMLPITRQGVIKAGDTILEIVPADAPLLVEAQVSPADIETVREGQLTEVRLSWLKGEDVTTLAGELVHVSADALIDGKTGRPYFKTRTRITDGAALARLGGALKPGAPAELLIFTGERTAFAYLVQPLRDGLNRALREY